MSDFDIQGTILLKYTGTNEDVVIPDGDIDDRYRQLKGCLEAKKRYEINRFR